MYMPEESDNPLHLAILCRDAYTVDVILAKMKNIQGDALSLMHEYEGSGFTRLLQAFTIFALWGVEADEELQIFRLVLEYRANPNDQDIANRETPLHLVVRAKISPVALGMIRKHSVNATLLKKAGQSATDITRKSGLEHAKDKWYSFAQRRMSNQLRDKDYRLPELVDFLHDEGGLDAEGKEWQRGS